ncbi:MAG TPA: phosphotransferase, partial [Thermomicrobiales bacterium]|nr:phosphotransferase [Thermomicrobiales bacterium]
ATTPCQASTSKDAVMSDTGQRPSITAIRQLVREHVSDRIEDIQPLTGGFFSRAFAFDAAGRQYVIRLNPEDHAAESFAKDDYAWRHFASPALPIPRIVATGTTADGYYAISELVADRTLGECTLAERQAVLPALLDTLEAVGQADVSASRGYGDWDGAGTGRFANWRAFLASAIDNHPDGYYVNWHAFFDDSFLERDLYETVFNRMLQLTAHCPEQRALIHNDFQFGNVLTDGERITGVIDWANALYGDPLYDVAWLIWQAANPGWWYDDAAMLHRRFGALPDYAERIACYQCHIGLDHLRFYTRTGNRTMYDTTRAWLLTVLATTPTD